MDLDYGKQYRLLFERHWWWRAREVVILDELHRLKPDGSWGNILDVGCGDGLFFPRLAELGEVEGVEPEASLLSEGRSGRRCRTRERVSERFTVCRSMRASILANATTSF